MSMEDLQQYVANDMASFLYYCSESEVVNEFLIKVEHTTDEQFYNKFVKFGSACFKIAIILCDLSLHSSKVFEYEIG